jgi:hypothetical protein
MKIDQVAWYARDEKAADELKIKLGLQDAKWIIDNVTGKSIFEDETIDINKGHLQFNYDLGIELEILTYTSGQHWHQRTNPFWLDKSQSFFHSHTGLHLDPGDIFPDMPGCLLVQETFTLSHTSEYLTTGAGAGRKYHYRIHQLSPGNYIKFIKRIQP